MTGQGKKGGFGRQDPKSRRGSGHETVYNSGFGRKVDNQQEKLSLTTNFDYKQIYNIKTIDLKSIKRKFTPFTLKTLNFSFFIILCSQCSQRGLKPLAMGFIMTTFFVVNVVNVVRDNDLTTKNDYSL